MSKRFYIVTFLTLSMAVILLTATYSKTSGITKYVDTHIMKDKFAIIYEDSNYYNVKKVGRLDQYKDVETYFLVNGRKILRFKSMKENNLKNGQIIMLNIVE